MKVDLYKTTHKTQRFHLFNLANEIGKADFTNEDTAQKIAKKSPKKLLFS